MRTTQLRVTIPRTPSNCAQIAPRQNSHRGLPRARALEDVSQVALAIFQRAGVVGVARPWIRQWIPAAEQRVHQRADLRRQIVLGCEPQRQLAIRASRYRELRPETRPDLVRSSFARCGRIRPAAARAFRRSPRRRDANARECRRESPRAPDRGIRPPSGTQTSGSLPSAKATAATSLRRPLAAARAFQAIDGRAM